MSEPLVSTRAKNLIGTAILVGLAVTTLTLAIFISRVNELLVSRGRTAAHVACFEQRVVEYETRKDRYIEAVVDGDEDGEPSLETLRAEALAAHFRVLRANNANVKDRCPLLPE